MIIHNPIDSKREARNSNLIVHFAYAVLSGNEER